MNLKDFIQPKFNETVESKPETTLSQTTIIQCSCGSQYISKLSHCPKCGLCHESEEEVRNWRKI
jgi:hypothetical protein